MQAALMLRAKSRERRKQRLKRGIKQELPSNVATKTIAPFPRYPPASWCAAGRAAWQEAAALSVGGGGAGAGGAARRCSVLGDHPGARRDPRGKWHRNNRVRDASYGSSSDSDGELEGISGEPWGVARLLYAGLATLAVGLVVYFVGTGDKGFKTPALRLVGPSLIVAGLACCLLRIAFCIFAKPCCRRRTNYKESRRLSGCVEGEEMPLAGSGSRGVGPAQCSPARRLDASSCDVSSLSSGEEDERMRRYRTASLHPPILHQVMAHQNGGQSGHRLSPQGTLRHSPSPQSAARHTPSPHSTMHHSPPTQAAALPGAAVQQSAIPSAVPLSATLPSAMASSANNANAGRRPPPRNVSFAGGSDGELVLSPAQLRS
ncbi:uncharacterized protein LOC114240687 isoform X2 [Bombyx mandarina]|uniref:Uncharacterized protein n=2 Tax=Bombyx TaxID=7090 RepID=A0A8R2HPI6_BOMMO|nr:uncharacterized protein LOC105842471 isoform X2 [Bombyx mori]XP_021207814.1 uncharacterized protein LOC105842471 isoform X2 [Bombyx mori]XP_028027127.1 uncharacterized protein LOC114240687 isoform X2 [Bombyx mandarina]XP_028027128.1 uncharacterized protein LOC114240687 isoform X2 [Bombyx mandarina]XP_028027129.1 uncharacterized protein LOC114240687 isoform X2 [Bombyx mandarina]XP_028027130.1 uncharacterized protein LOC114240687 isoform X2 [Bombyx mandarina]